jgi:hypothetical protein
LDSPDDPDSTGPDSSAAADDTAPWKAGAEPLRPTEADVAALATQAVIQDQVAALEAIVVPPSAEADAEAARRWSLGEFAPPDEALYWDQHHDEAPDRPDQADHDHDRTTPTDYADVHQDAERPEEEIGATASQDGPGDGDGRNADAVALDWPAAQVTPPPALSSLAEQLDPVPPAAATIIVHAAAEPVEFALPPLPEDLADVLAAAPPLNEAAPPYEPVAVAEVDEDATLVLEPINEDIEPIRPPVVRERPPNRAKQSLDGELAKPVSHDQTPPGLDDEQVGQALSGLTPPNTRPPVDLLAAATLTGGATGGGAISGDLSSQAAEPPGFDPATVPPELNAPPVRPAADTLDAASGPETTGANVLSVPTAGAPAVAAGGGPGASDPPHGAQQLFDVEPPSFDNVLAGDSAPAPAKRNWWPLVTFIAVAVACVSLGLLILQQVGVLSLGAVGTSVWPQPAGPAAVG